MFFKHAKTELTLLDHGSLKDLMSSKDVPREVIQRLGSMTPVANYLDDYAYIRHRAISAREHYGPNGNHDSFPQKDLQRATPTFINTGFYKDHANWDKSLAYGINLDAYYHPKHFVVLLSAVSRKFKPDSPEVVANIIANKWNQTSMGAAVGWSECSHCANKAHSPEEYCNHIRFAKGQMIDGKVVEEINHDFEFFEDSLITTEAADRDARIAEVFLPEDILKSASLQPDILRGDFTDYIRMPHVRLAKMMQELKAARQQNVDTTNAHRGIDTDKPVVIIGGSVPGSTTKTGEAPKRSGDTPVGLPENAPTVSETDTKDLTRTKPNDPNLPGGATPVADQTNTAPADQITQVKDNADYSLAAKALAQAAKALEGLSMKPVTAKVEGTVPLMIATQHGMQAGEAATAFLKGKANDVDPGMIGQIKSYISSIPLQSEEIRAEVSKMLTNIKAVEMESSSTASPEAPVTGESSESAPEELASAAAKKDKDKLKKDKLKKNKKTKKGMLGRLASLLTAAADDEDGDTDLDDLDIDEGPEKSSDGASVEGLKGDLKQVQQEIATGIDMLDSEKDKLLARKRKATLASTIKKADEDLQTLQTSETGLVEVKHEVEDMLAGFNEGNIPASKEVEKVMSEVRECLDEHAGPVDVEGRLKSMAIAYIPSFVGRRIKGDISDAEPSGAPEKPKDGNMEQMIDRGDYNRPGDPWAEWVRTFNGQEKGTRTDIDRQRDTGFATPEEQIKQRDLKLASMSPRARKLVGEARSAYIKLRTAGKTHDEALLTITSNLTRLGVSRRRTKKVKKASGLDLTSAKRRKRTKKSKASLSEKTSRLKTAMVARYETIRRMGATHEQALLIVSNDMTSLGVSRRRQSKAKKAAGSMFSSSAKRRKRAKKAKKPKMGYAAQQERNTQLRQAANQKYNNLRAAGISHQKALSLVKSDLLRATAAPMGLGAPADPSMMGGAPTPEMGGEANEDTMNQIVQRTADELADRIFEANPATPENMAAADQTGMPPAEQGAQNNAAAFGIPPVMVSSLREGRPSMDSGFEQQADIHPTGDGAGTIGSDESPSPTKNFPDDPSDPAWDLFPEDQISGVVRESNSEQEAQLKQDLKGVYVPASAARQQKQISPRTIYPNAARQVRGGRSTEDSDEKALLSLQLAQSEVDAGLVPQADLEQEAQRLFRMSPDQLRGVESTLQKVAARRFPHPDSRKDIVTQAMAFSGGFGSGESELEENLFDE